MRDTRSGTTLRLVKWGDIAIEKGALERGVVNDGTKLSDALRAVKEKTGVANVCVSLPEERAYLFETEIRKDIPAKEIRSLLEFRLEENVPISPRDAFFDYDIIENNEDQTMLSVSVTAYTKDTVMSYYDACRSAGVVPVSFEVEAQAIARATIAVDDIGTHMVVDFGQTRTGIGIVHKGVLMYTSTIDIGGANLSVALRAILGDVPESELTTIKNTQGLLRGFGDHRVYDALYTSVKSIADEINIRISYWNTKDIAHEHRQIQSLILCGGSVNMKGLPQYLTQTLGVRVEKANVWRNAFSIEDIIPPIDRRHSFGYATAVGLGITSFV
jgi:type IV pilus assembly protein PilM